MEERVEVVDGARAAHRRREGYRGGSDGDEVRVRVRARMRVEDACRGWSGDDAWGLGDLSDRD